MRSKFEGWKTLLLTAVLGMLAFADLAQASDTWFDTFHTAYPAAVGSRIDSCLLCHQTASGSPSSPRNAYGIAFDAAGHSYTAINAADSDLDGFTNLEEINQFFFPGNNADHPAQTVTIVATDPTAAEAGATTGQFTVTRSVTTSAALTVIYSVAGTATAGSDYVALSGSVQIPASAATATVTVTPINDTAVEANETVVATIGANSAYTVGAPASATVTIQSDDGSTLPTVTIAATDLVATEAGTTTGQFTVTRTGVTTAALTVIYTVAGTATPASDYLALTGTVQIPVGSATATVTVTPIDDLAAETDETVVATISANAAYTVGTPASATVTIQSDDVLLPTVTITAADPTAGEAGTTTGQFMVTRTGVTTAGLTVNYTVAGTATAGSDYLTLSGSVQIPAGAAAATITVTPIDDTAVEANETVVATISANAAYTVGTLASATVTIQSDDGSTLPTVTIAALDPTATEAGTATGQFTVTRTGATTVALTVSYTVAGTATPASDYQALAGTVQIPAGSATATVTVTPIDDTAVETDETVVATLSANAAYTVGTPASATVTIQSDDPVLPTVTITAADPTAGEAGTTTGQFMVTRTGVTTSVLTVNYTVAGTATAGSDYLTLSGSVQIPAGAAATTITVSPIDDLAVEVNETVVATLSANAAYTVGTPASATVTIQSDDVSTLPTVTIAATVLTATEAGATPGQFTVTRTGATTAALIVSYTIAGTATPATDYLALAGTVQIPAGSATATVIVTPIDDTAVETNETVVATLSATATYTVGTPASATVTIQSDDPVLPTVTITATDPTAAETGTTTGQFTVARTGVTTAALTVNYTVAGTATAGSDYLTLSGSVQIPAGATTATITVAPIDDLVVEIEETVVVTLGANAAYIVGTPASATLIIQSDEVSTLPTVTIAATDSTATEAGTTTGQFTLTRTGITTAALTVNYAVAGTATAGSDYVALAGSVQIPAGAATATVTVTPIDDAEVETDETVVATLTAAAGYNVGVAASATVTIQSDDLPTVTIAATDAIATEAGTTTGQFTLTRTGATTAALTVNYTVAGTATAGSDYLTLSGSVQIPAGAATATITVMPIDDLVAESDETVAATLSANAAYIVGGASGAIVTIQSDDAAAVLTLTVASTNPSSGVSIAVSPNDNGNLGNGLTEFTRSYYQGVQVTLTASSTFGGPRFISWSGCDSATGTICLVTMDAARTVMADYSASTAYVLWTRGDFGKAALWKIDPGLAAGAPAVIPVENSAWLYSATGVGAGWEATSYEHIGSTEGYVLWTRRDTGKAALWKIDPSLAVGYPPVIPPVSAYHLYSVTGVGAGWQATSYEQVGPTEAYVLWTRRDTGKAALWRIDPSLAAGSPAVIPIVSSSLLYSADGVGTPWEATSYQHVSATEGYVLWTRADVGQAGLWQINPSGGTPIIPITANLYSSPMVGGPWKATSYLHVSATEGYLLWTRRDTGQAAVWRIDPGAGPGTPPLERAFLYSSSGIGGNWQATGYVFGGVNATPPVADQAMPDDVQAAVDVLKAGGGAGTIEFGGVTCGPACETVTLPHAAREAVMVTAAPGSRFAGWETADGVAIDILQAQPGEKVYAVFEQQ